MADDEPPRFSRLGRDDRRYRVLQRVTAYRRHRAQLPLVELLASVLENRGLTDAVRKHCVCIYWPEIVGERFASKSFPASFTGTTLQVFASSSPWVHELQLVKSTLIAKVNAWVEANQKWLGPPPLVSDMRFALLMRQRDPIADLEQIRRLRVEQARRAAQRAADTTPPVASDAERAAIVAEVSAVEDPELRAAIEAVRLAWNR